jgi:hypothetical protein
MRHLIALPCLCMILLVADAGWADTGVVTTRDGKTHHGEIDESGGKVTVTIGTSVMRLSRDDVMSIRSDEEIKADFEARSREVELDNFDGQFALLKWCHEQGRQDLTVLQAQRVLRLEPQHEPTREILKSANDALSRERKARREARGGRDRPGRAAPRAHTDREPPAAGELDPTRKLTTAEINRLRFGELKALRLKAAEPDSAQVTVPRDTALAFLEKMEGHEDFNTPDQRNRFLQASPDMKLAVIANLTDMEFADQVTIRTDPELYQTFRRKVMPAVLHGCATSRCHGGANSHDATGLRLWDDPKDTNASVYTNFLLLDEYEMSSGDGQKFLMIDRARPDESLLLNWMVRPDQTPFAVPHPGNVKLDPPYLNREHPGYHLLRDWIASLRVPRPDYGVYLTRKPAPPEPVDKKEATQPAGEQPETPPGG